MLQRTRENENSELALEAFRISPSYECKKKASLSTEKDVRGRQMPTPGCALVLFKDTWQLGHIQESRVFPGIPGSN